MMQPSPPTLESATLPDQRLCYAGVDIGSTTVKIAIIEAATGELLHSEYVRHNADQKGTFLQIMRRAHQRFAHLVPVICGSGGVEIARVTGAFFVQEVVATGIVVQDSFPSVRTAIELGGQDAKLIFFVQDENGTSVSDMRMNGSCAGGTGAFIDQIADLLSVPPEEFGPLAERARHTHEISGRCGVFAKTDIQPLLNQGIPREDIALSAFHAIAKQTIGGLAQGMEIKSPVIFLGGPLTFNPSLVKVFREKLALPDAEAIVPDQAEILVARGAALSVPLMFADTPVTYTPASLDGLEAQGNDGSALPVDASAEPPFFSTVEELNAFRREHALPEFVPYIERVSRPSREFHLPVYLGIDAGSTTSKFVLLDEMGQIVDKFYARNQADPLRVVREGLLELYQRYLDFGIRLDVLAAGSTGYGERLFATAFQLDYHTVETVAHTRAATSICPEVSFILDIGGQDMKAIYVKHGIPVNFQLNEACSAGCGSFLETYAAAMNVGVQEIADLAFASKQPSRLGSRCTVFMNSSIITEQKNGRPVADIFGGLCHSVIENAITKVLRVAAFEDLGTSIIAQGGTFKNDAVFRAFQMKTGQKIIRPDHPGEMGAIGIALLAKEHREQTPELQHNGSRFSFTNLQALQSTALPASVCRFCTNECNRSIVSFSHGGTHVTGNRCERGEILGDPKDASTRARVRAAKAQMDAVPDLLTLREKLLVRDFPYEPVVPLSRDGTQQTTIGIPRSLEFFNSLPFWRHFFLSLGFRVQLSSPSSYVLFDDSLASVPSDTVCLPAKLAHGHVKDLIRKKVDRIFNPMMLKVLRTNQTTANSWTCPVIQGYSEIVRISDDPLRRHGIPYDAPPFQFEDVPVRNRQILRYARTLGLKKAAILKAIEQGDRAQLAYRTELENAAISLLAKLQGGTDFAVVLAGRPYHADSFVNHDLARHFTSLGIPVLEMESIPGLDDIDLSSLMIETNNAFHARLLAAAVYAANHPSLELVQIVSFGCGHDAVLSDELVRVMKHYGEKVPLVLKLDEGENRGPTGIRVKSFIETVRRQRREHSSTAHNATQIHPTGISSSETARAGA